MDRTRPKLADDQGPDGHDDQRLRRNANREVPKGMFADIVLDNYGTHAHAEVKEWLARRPRFHPHFTPTSSS